MNATNHFYSLFFLFFVITSVAYPQHHWENIISEDVVFSYFIADKEPVSYWNSQAFNDDNWDRAKGGIGYGDVDDATNIEQCPYSLYLRHKFIIADSSLIDYILLDIDFDDAFVAYLNGVEIARSNILGTPPAFDALPMQPKEAKMYKGGIPDRFKVEHRFLQGENLLAIQIINYLPTSSDLTSRVYINARVDSPTIQYKNVPAWFQPPDINTEVQFTKSNLPLIFIQTDQGREIPREGKIGAHMGVVHNPNGINYFNDPYNHYDGRIGIDGRGSSSWEFDKKNYNIETRTALDSNNNVTLLGLPAENDWVLHGPYSDKSLIRNAISYNLGAQTGWWSPKTHFCELILNDDYKGIYLLVEKIKRDKNRVNISKLKPSDIAGNELTGGYILSIDRGTFYEGAWIPQYHFIPGADPWIKYNIVYPKHEDIQPVQREYIINYVTQFEEALHGPDFKDPQLGYRPFTVISSFIDYFIINELTRNIDAYRLSAYFHKLKNTKGGQLVMGPIWDFNLSMGNGNYNNNWLTYGWAYESTTETPFWWKRFRQDPYFNSCLKQRWIQLRQDALSNQYILGQVDSFAILLQDAKNRNFSRFNVLGSYVWPNYFIGNTYYEEINYLKNYITGRLNWMDSQIGSIVSTEECTACFECIPSIVSAYQNTSIPNSGKQLYAYPNPCIDRINFQLPTAINGPYHITLFNSTGMLIKTIYGQSGSMQQSIPIILSDLKQNGIIFYQLEINKQHFRGKFIKQYKVGYY